jgi:3-oxoacyl-(acyl-carrier-protein) synthase
MTGTPVVIVGASRLLPDGYGWYWFNSVRAIDGNTGIPFDKNSRGFRPGEAQFFAVISAKPINPIAAIEDMRFFSITSQFTDTGSVEQVEKNLFDGFDMRDVCWWNAHSPGTPMGDRAEHTIFNNVVGVGDMPISSLKGEIGHTLVASFLVETGLGIQSLMDGYIPPNTGIINPIVDDPRIIIKPVSTTGKTFIKFNMGFGGKNVLSRIKVYG